MNTTYAENQTGLIAEQLLAILSPSENGATVLALQGDLGAGKTTLTKSLANKLGVIETVVSPTFVIAKFYDVEKDFKQMVHIDAYRIESLEELAPLGWQTILKQPNTLVVVEWPERISSALPEQTQYFAITHDDDQRTITQL